MVQNRLLDLIDTMSDVLANDRARILRLEQEIARLKAAMRTSSVIPQQAPAYSIPPPASPPAPNQQLPSASPYQSTPPSQPSTNYPLGPDPTTSVADRYTEALKIFNQGNYQLALERFQELQLLDPNGALAANYGYWKGEAQYALGRYTDAITTFHEVLEQFPNSTKTDDAEFKIAESYEKLGNTTNARNVYRRLLREHPSTEYKSRIEARLRILE
jgi:tol-pal system protein YbgF